MSSSWATAPPPSTPLAVNRYFDTCVEWLLDTNLENDSAPTNSPGIDAADVPDTTWSSIGVCDDEAVLNVNAKCFICSKTASVALIGNPFCRAHICQTCEDCARKVSG